MVLQHLRSNMETNKLGLELSKLLFELEPKLLTADLEASARAAVEVSNILGCILATVIVKNPKLYEAAFKRVMEQIHQSAIKTAEKSVTIDTNVTPH